MSMKKKWNNIQKDRKEEWKFYKKKEIKKN